MRRSGIRGSAVGRSPQISLAVHLAYVLVRSRVVRGVCRWLLSPIHPRIAPALGAGRAVCTRPVIRTGDNNYNPLRLIALNF